MNERFNPGVGLRLKLFAFRGDDGRQDSVKVYGMRGDSGSGRSSPSSTGRKAACDPAQRFLKNQGCRPKEKKKKSLTRVDIRKDKKKEKEKDENEGIRGSL